MLVAPGLSAQATHARVSAHVVIPEPLTLQSVGAPVLVERSSEGALFEQQVSVQANVSYRLSAENVGGTAGVIVMRVDGTYVSLEPGASVEIARGGRGEDRPAVRWLIEGPHGDVRVLRYTLTVIY